MTFIWQEEKLVIRQSDVQLLYLGTLVRTVLSLHDLVKVKEESLKKKEEEKEKDGEKVNIAESSDDDDFIPIF